MSNDKIIEEYIFETLYGIDVNGKTKIWKLKVEKYNNYSEIVTIYGYNKLIETRRQINTGKNLKKSNATDHYTQAIQEAKSKWVKKKDIEKYLTKELSLANDTHDNINKTDEINKVQNPLPMLAHDYNKHKEKVQKLLKESKIMIQVKIDGIRFIYNSTNDTCTTRQGKSLNIVKKTKELYKDLLSLQKTGLIFDGELYTNKVNFETLGILRKTNQLTEEDIINLEKIEYHIYDIIDTTLNFEQRNKIIKDLFSNNKYNKLVYVNTIQINSEEDIKNNHIKFLENGYEGTMIRNKDSLYKIKQRSHDLLKYKDFQDAEFKIVDYTVEKDTSGKDENLIVWIVEVPLLVSDEEINNNQDLNTKDKNQSPHLRGEVKVRPKGTVEERKELYKKCVEDFTIFKGRKLWVKFFNFTANGSLRFPSTMRNSYIEYIRDEIL